MKHEEGGLKAPLRHPIALEDPLFTNQEAIEKEMERVFDICHGCRRCFNLCDSFPKLFDLIDETPSGELHDVSKERYKDVVDSCTLCDMCFMTKCPYVPPHEFDLDFPHLMLRYKAMEHAKGKSSFVQGQLGQTDRNGKIGTAISPVVNWATKKSNTLTRTVMEKTTGIDKRAHLPSYAKETFIKSCEKNPMPANKEAPGYGNKVVLYATCLGNYHKTELANAARFVLTHNGVEVTPLYPQCCGMPFWEQGDLESVKKGALKIAAFFEEWIDKGYDVVSLTPSCTFMLKNEWKLLLPDNVQVQKLSQATFDISEYLVALNKEKGLVQPTHTLEGGVTVHLACHSRAQNMGAKAAELLSLIPDTSVKVIERCSGHGGSFGVMKQNYDIAMKVGKPVCKTALKNETPWVVSECPLASDHIKQGMDDMDTSNKVQNAHPIQLFALAYGEKFI